MNNNNYEMRLYYCDNNIEYGSVECWAFYVSCGLLYIYNKEDIFRILEKPSTEFKYMGLENIDSYMKSRGFEKVIDFIDRNKIIWNDEYKDKKDEVKNAIKNMNYKIKPKLRYEFYKVDHSLSAIQVLLSLSAKMI